MSTKIAHRSRTRAVDADLPVVIREAGAGDRAALRRLADLDSSPVPAGPLIVAEVDGELRSAVSVVDGRAIADPFARTAEVAALAELRAAQVRSANGRPMRIVARTPSPARRQRRLPGTADPALTVSAHD